MIWWLPDECLTTAWRLLYDCMMTAWRRTAWRLHDDCMMNTWQMPGNCLMNTLRMPDNCIMTPWKGKICRPDAAYSRVQPKFTTWEHIKKTQKVDVFIFNLNKWTCSAIRKIHTFWKACYARSSPMLWTRSNMDQVSWHLAFRNLIGQEYILVIGQLGLN